jgi:hypothetical protein
MIVSAMSVAPVRTGSGFGAAMQRHLRTGPGRSITPAVDALMFAVVVETIPECAVAEIAKIILYTYRDSEYLL